MIQPRRGPASPGEAPTSPYPSQRRCPCSPWHGTNPNPIARPAENTTRARSSPSTSQTAIPPCHPHPLHIPISFPTSHGASSPPKPCADRLPARSCSAALQPQGFPAVSRSKAVHLLTATANPTGPPRSILRGRLGCRARREELGESRNRHPPVQHPKNTPREGACSPARRHRSVHPSLDEATEENLVSPSHRCIPTPGGTPIRAFHSQTSAGPAIPRHLPGCPRLPVPKEEGLGPP